MTHADIHDLLSEEEREALARSDRTRQRERWGSIAWLLGGASLATLLAAGIVLSHAGVGSAVVLRGCSWPFAAGLALLLAAGCLLGLTHLALRMQHAYAWRFDGGNAFSYAAPPLAVAALTVPGFVGCDIAVRLSRLGVLGDAIVGAPGIALAAASCYGFGYSLFASCRIDQDEAPPPPSSVTRPLTIRERRGPGRRPS